MPCVAGEGDTSLSHAGHHRPFSAALTRSRLKHANPDRTGPECLWFLEEQEGEGQRSEGRAGLGESWLLGLGKAEFDVSRVLLRTG